MDLPNPPAAAASTTGPQRSTFAAAACHAGVRLRVNVGTVRAAPLGTWPARARMSPRGHRGGPRPASPRWTKLSRRRLSRWSDSFPDALGWRMSKGLAGVNIPANREEVKNFISFAHPICARKMALSSRRATRSRAVGRGSKRDPRARVFYEDASSRSTVSSPSSRTRRLGGGDHGRQVACSAALRAFVGGQAPSPQRRKPSDSPNAAPVGLDVA